MEKEDHGKALAAVMARKGLSRQDVADVAGVNVRTVTNWTTGKTMPSRAERETLRRYLGVYDDTEGDPVERAVRASRLTEDRQYAVLGVYKRELREQDEADEGRRGA
jgi:transcriptional regulator with XRE-family HTH domain